MYCVNECLFLSKNINGPVHEVPKKNIYKCTNIIANIFFFFIPTIQGIKKIIVMSLLTQNQNRIQIFNKTFLNG